MSSSITDVSVQSTPAYMIRLDILDRDDSDYRNKMRQFVEANAGGFLVVSEKENENHHWHILIFSDKTIKQLRSSLSRYFPQNIGNKGVPLIFP